MLVTSCYRDVDLQPVPDSEKLVIEGSIETGQAARVLITRSLPFYERVYTTDLIDILVLDAEVFVHCGENSEQLFLVRDDILPDVPVYHGSRIRGETGKSYTLEVRIGDQVITATDLMLDPVHPERIWFSSEPGQDSLGYVNVDIRDPAGESNYYRIWAKRLGRDSVYKPVNQDILNDFYFNGSLFSMPFMMESSLLSREDSAYFRRGDHVVIKMAHMTPALYEVLTNVGYEARNLANPFAIHFEAYSNLEGDAVGGWGCYSTVTDTLMMEP